MIEKGRKKGTVRFAYKPQHTASQVRVAGDFSEWQPLPMRKQKDGSHVALVSLTPGTYEYKFMVDGQWQGNPDSHCWAPNAFGTMNSVAQID